MDLNLKNTSGVYCIRNIKDNKRYVGSSVNIQKRCSGHYKTLVNNHHHHSIKLRRAWDKYGEDNFVFEILEMCERDILKSREQYYIEIFDSYNSGYNCTDNSRTSRGCKQSAESVEKRVNTCNKLRAEGKGWYKGRKHSEESKQKIKEKRKLQSPPSEETRKIIGQKSKGNKYRLGQSPSEETREKMRIIMTGRKLSDGAKEKLRNRTIPETTKKKISESRIGKKLSEEHKQKLKEKRRLQKCPRTGKKHSEESKEKMRQKRIEYLNRRNKND